MKNLIERFVKDDSGVTAVEYALIIILIAVGIIGAGRFLASQISTTFDTAKTTMKSA